MLDHMLVRMLRLDLSTQNRTSDRSSFPDHGQMTAPDLGNTGSCHSRKLQQLVGGGMRVLVAAPCVLFSLLAVCCMVFAHAGWRCAPGGGSGGCAAVAAAAAAAAVAAK